MVKWVTELHLHQKNPPSYHFPSWQSQKRHHRFNKQEQFVILHFNTVGSTLWTFKWWGVGCEGLITDGGQAGHQSVGAEQLYCALFVYLGFYFSLFFIAIIIIIILYFKFWTVLVSTHKFYLFLILLPILPGWCGRKWVSSCVVLRD